MLLPAWLDVSVQGPAVTSVKRRPETVQIAGVVDAIAGVSPLDEVAVSV